MSNKEISSFVCHFVCCFSFRSFFCLLFNDSRRVFPFSWWSNTCCAVQHGWVEHVCDYKRCGFPPAAKEGYREPDDATLCWLVLQSDHTLRTFRSDVDEKKTKKGSVLRSINLSEVVAVGRADAMFAGREEGDYERILKETGAGSNTVRETFHRSCFALAMQNGTVIIFRPQPPANGIIGGHGWGDWTPDGARLSWIDNIEIACEEITARTRVRNRVSLARSNSPRVPQVRFFFFLLKKKNSSRSTTSTAVTTFTFSCESATHSCYLARSVRPRTHL